MHGFHLMKMEFHFLTTINHCPCTQHITRTLYFCNYILLLKDVQFSLLHFKKQHTGENKPCTVHLPSDKTSLQICLPPPFFPTDSSSMEPEFLQVQLV